MEKNSWVTKQREYSEESLQQCLAKKLETTDAVIVRYYDEDGVHYHVHTRGGLSGTKEFLEVIRDEYIPAALRAIGEA